LTASAVDLIVRRNRDKFLAGVRSKGWHPLHEVSTGPAAREPWMRARAAQASLSFLALCIAGGTGALAILCAILVPRSWPTIAAVWAGCVVVMAAALYLRAPGSGWHRMLGTGFARLAMEAGSTTLMVCEEVLVAAMVRSDGPMLIVYEYGEVDAVEAAGGRLTVRFRNGSEVVIRDPRAEPVDAVPDGVHTELAEAVTAIEVRASAAAQAASEGSRSR
jgi:hypothetical protein